jgi:spermidine synthase
VLRVIERGDQHILMHGTTQHGFESFAPGMRDRPEAYYAASGPAGQVFTIGQRTTPFRRVGVVGLGAGSLAAYGRPGQRFTFYEIDPGVVRIAEDPRWFTFMHDSRATLRVVVGDGRLELRHAPDHGYDLLALDAFSSDAVPAHLLTVQALRLYLDKLAPGGRLLFHISNRHLDLEPVLASEARALGLAGLDQRDLHVTPAQRAAGKQASEWVLLARDRAALARFTADPRWRPLHGSTQVWTDDFSNILGVIDWTR